MYKRKRFIEHGIAVVSIIGEIQNFKFQTKIISSQLCSILFGCYKYLQIKAVNLAGQRNFGILVALLHEKSNLYELSNKHKMWYLKNTT